MGERYQKLYSLENNLYTAGSPVLIAAAVLLRDSYSKNLLAQVKLKNIGSRVIKAVKVGISMRDTTGAPLGQKPLQGLRLRLLAAGLDTDLDRRERDYRRAARRKSGRARSPELFVIISHNWCPGRDSVQRTARTQRRIDPRWER